MTLDDDTLSRLDRHARKSRVQRASLAKQLLREALVRRDAQERARALARDYAADRADARALLEDLEAGQLDLLARK